jgi:putative transposase
MDERLRFVARLLEGEKMAPLCAEFGISRRTGYKIFDRYKDCGVQAFSDRSHRAHRQANRLSAPIEATIVRLKREYPGWGAPKIREKLRQQFTGPHLPTISTVHAVLHRHHLVRHRRRRRPRARSTELSRPTHPNALWCADYKSEFLLGNRRYCYPLTITDFASRYLLSARRCSPRKRNSPSPCSSAPSKNLAFRRGFGPITASRLRRRMRSTA